MSNPTQRAKQTIGSVVAGLRDGVCALCELPSNTVTLRTPMIVYGGQKYPATSQDVPVCDSCAAGYDTCEVRDPPKATP